MSDRPEWWLTQAERRALWDADPGMSAEGYDIALCAAQAKKLVEYVSEQLFDEVNMDESLVMLSGVIIAPQWLVQLRKDVGP